METYRTVVSQWFHGRLHSGKHAPGGAEACALEALSVLRKTPWTDDPHVLGIWDIRPLNDCPWPSAEKRADAMILLVDALNGCTAWSGEKQCAVVTTIVVGTAKHILSMVPGLRESVQQQCRAAGTLQAALAAAEAIRAAGDICAVKWEADWVADWAADWVIEAVNSVRDGLVARGAWACAKATRDCARIVTGDASVVLMDAAVHLWRAAVVEDGV